MVHKTSKDNTKMRAIPQKLKNELEQDAWYKRCCITGRTKIQEKIEWHHNFIFAGRQVNEKWCILPMAKSIHDREKEQEIKTRLNWIMFNRADNETLKKYSKAIDLLEIKELLNKKFGEWDPWGRY